VNNNFEGLDILSVSGTMDQPIPDWLTNDFLRQCLQKESGSEEIVVTNHIITPVAPPGNNYGSFIVRVAVEYKHSTDDSATCSRSLIVKSELTEGDIKEMFDNLSDLQQSEYDFYYKFLAKAEKLIDTGFAPKSFFSPMNSVTILEDLKESGFVMADRTKQLDFDHCRLYIEASATMHAASIAVHKEDPHLIESMGREKMFRPDDPGHEMFVSMIKGGLEVFAQATEKVEKYKKYAQVIREVIPLLWGLIVDAHKPSDALNSFNQGDPWTANMMFKYDELGNVSEVKIIDFQCLRYASPINDVVFFIWPSANNHVKSHRLEELYQIYFETFNNKLQQVHCDERLTIEHFNECLEKLSPSTMFLVASFLPLLIHPDPVDFGKFSTKNQENSEEIVLNYYLHYYNEQFCREHVPQSLEQLEKAGVFKHLEYIIKKSRK